MATSTTTQTTSAEEVRHTFEVTDQAKQAFQSWTGDQRRTDVIPVVLSHVTSALYRLTPAEVQYTSDTTAHALGQVRKSDINHIAAAHDWSPGFAFTHVFHILLEKIQRVPSWDEFCAYINDDSEGRAQLGNCRDDKYWELVNSGVDRELAWQALHWRTGNAYYGLLRDVYTVVELRALGFDVRAHPLADALFRVDAWSGRTILSLLVGNDKYRSACGGRKLRPQDLYRRAQPPFLYEEIDLPAAETFGDVHLPSPADIAAKARALALS